MVKRKPSSAPPDFGGATRIEEYRLSERTTLRPGERVKVRGTDGGRGFQGTYLSTWIEGNGRVSVAVREHERGVRHVRPERIVRRRYQP